jgi:pimeloyl-ACP methyl ester carboxylesterase
MTTTTHHTQRPPTPAGGPAATGRQPRTGPIRPVIAGSLLTGAVLAAVLPLVVFGSGSEAVITGSAMLGFAAGWGMLAVLSTRMTSQPQRWAWVSAAALGATGLWLLITAPDDRVLTAAGWVWPPLLLALAVWMGIRVRRTLAPGSGRWLLYPVAAVMAAAAVGGAVETVGLASDQRSYAMPGQLYDVGGHRLHLDCTGSGSPTVVLMSGLGQNSAGWARIAPAVAGTSRVCAYDRAGQGWSEDAPARQDGVAAASDLHTLLDRAGEDGPYLLVGHSIGGDHAMVYADRYPEQVAGMVLLDATSPYQTAAGTTHAGPPGPVAVVPSLARLGVGRLFPTSFWSALPEPAASRYTAFATSPRSWRTTVDETATIPALLSQAQELSTLGRRPLVVLSAAGLDADPARADAHDRMTGLSTNSSHRAVDASHGGLLDEEGGAADSVHAIEDVVRTVRTGTNLPRD